MLSIEEDQNCVLILRYAPGCPDSLGPSASISISQITRNSKATPRTTIEDEYRSRSSDAMTHRSISHSSTATNWAKLPITEFYGTHSVRP
jgi:hypothetical protein